MARRCGWSCRRCTATRASSGSNASPSCRTRSPGSGSSAATTTTPGWVDPTSALAEPRLVRRFGATERTLHWVHAGAFFTMLATGLLLYLPALSALVGSRETVKHVHLYTAVAWAAALVVVTLAGDRRSIARTLRDLDAFD